MDAGDEPKIEGDHPISAGGAAVDRERVVQHFLSALDEALAAVRRELAAGRKPRRASNVPTVSIEANGMPRISDGSSWDHTGPLQYAELLEGPRTAAAPFGGERFPVGRYPAVDSLVALLSVDPGATRSFAAPPMETTAFDFMRIQVELWLVHAVNRILQLEQHGGNRRLNRAAVLAPAFRGMFDERVNVSTVVPIALVRFETDRMRLAPDAYLMRMDDRLQRQRWAVKAYGASGHDGVVAAATHAFVITGWHWPNLPWLQMSASLVARTPELRARIEELFAALRIVTGVATGYAQELRVARGWTHLHTDQPPEVHAAGARRYPEAFDDFGWTREDLPIVTRDDLRSTGAALERISANRSERLTLALRRLNGAMIREDLADAILDATIGLEILLGDGDSQAIGYKLRLRAAALVGLDARGAGRDVADAVKRVYDARSRIVHGARSRRSGDEEAHLKARDAAIDTLRRVVLILLEHPRFLDPAKIDAELLIG